MIILPDYVSPNAAAPRLIDNGIWNKGAMGGTTTRTDRPGNRFGLQITLPPTWSDLQGTALLADLILAKREGLRFTWPVGAFSSASIGDAVVDGNDVQGTSLPLRGMEPNTIVRKGQFFTITHNGDSFLHMSASEVLADASGEVTLTVEPELRAILADGDVCAFGRPFMEGFIDGETWEWEYRIDKFMSLTFDLEEIA